LNPAGRSLHAPADREALEAKAGDQGRPTGPVRRRARQQDRGDAKRISRLDIQVTTTGATGLEPAASGVTGRRSNQLSYAPEAQANAAAPAMPLIVRALGGVSER
jgi:hypothetical protein